MTDTEPVSSPSFHPLGDGRLSAHGSAVRLNGQGLLILGASGSGKSGLTAQLLALGAELIADDMVWLEQAESGDHVTLRRPDGGPSLIELRGLGLASCATAPSARLSMFLLLQDSSARLPTPEAVDVFGKAIALHRHPYRFDLAAKIWVWMQRVPG